MKIYKYNFLLEKILESQKEDVKKIIRNKVLYYENFTIPKKGGVRTICGLKKDMLEPRLIQMQKQLYKRFLSKIPVSIHAKALPWDKIIRHFWNRILEIIILCVLILKIFLALFQRS